MRFLLNGKELSYWIEEFNPDAKLASSQGIVNGWTEAMVKVKESTPRNSIIRKIRWVWRIFRC